MSVIVGIGGASRNAAVALCNQRKVVAVCEHERITRTRRASLRSGQLPRETLSTTLKIGRCLEGEISTFAIAEAAIRLPAEHPIEYVDHHFAHAATAFFSSPFRDAVVIVCDRRSVPELTVWQGDGSGVRRLPFPWRGPAFASLYSMAAEAMGFGREGDEHQLEALARVGEEYGGAAVAPASFHADHLEVPSSFQASISGVVGRNGSSVSAQQRANLARHLQRAVGDLLLEMVAEVRRRFGGDNVCLGGGLFYNSYFTTLTAESHLYANTFVPANPGNAGVAVGAAFAVAAAEGPLDRDAPLSPFLGPEFTPQEIKATLDNCKLSYDYLHNGLVVERTTAALLKGSLVGWFQGRMEWGPRALGNRSILASPFAPYVLENLNVFLKHREAHRSYSVAICREDLARYFKGPAQSTFMEYEYEVIDRDRFRELLPANANRLRVQTVDETAGEFYDLLRAVGDATGLPMLVNTSFNGFNEPIVCNPRDAVRVFYGTGLDMAVLGGLVLEK